MDFAPTVKTPSPAPNEKPSVEKPMPAPEPSNDNDAAPASAAESRLDTEELEADTRKRKRRSPSPDVPAKDIKAKKPRPSDDAAPDVHLKEDEDLVMEQRAPEEEIIEENKVETTDAPSVPEETAPAASEIKEKEKEKEKNARYKDLFKSAGAVETPTSAPAAEPETDEGPIIPALHVATPALYIRDLMRPLRIEALRNHLMSLATPPSATPDPSIVTTIFLDSLKSHALVLFSTTKAASRVRASLHNTVWPAESQRKPLWIDFVPEDKIKDWIQEEEDYIAAEKAGRAAGKPIPQKRFEVVYPVDPQTGEVHAVFQEVGAGAPRNAPKGPRAGPGIEDRRRSEAGARERESVKEARPTTDMSAKRDLTRSFQTLDQLFLSTTTKPKLYYLPVSDARADRRRDDLDDETARDWRPGDRVRGRGASGNPLDRKMRYSFDVDDRVVEVGGDFGPWADDSVARGGVARGGGGGGGFRSERGGGGGGFRGGRGGWRGGY
ncbi:uncharacterized protein EI97DRAFT_415305 [Westerdykella ornata]|uniref:RRM domain-containing protein n=1 Tax=Westerdykella ornata TaxID=318751 RepID=A0A6A6JPY0_WESOR|nr:uncharacterized protein EI97DRAFT_415305 [Westerdykella ornata]KAF2277736.1 hypothetical protein EI97DRAFT_415305 [Westerdykella ornata]